MGSDEWDSFHSNGDFSNLKEFELAFFGRDFVKSKLSFWCVKKTVVFLGLLDGDNIHESSWEGLIGSDLSVNFDDTLHQDLCDFSSCQSVLETITE